MSEYQATLRRANALDGAPVLPRKEVNFLWQLHVIFQYDYESYCDRHFGRFVDHHVFLPRSVMEAFARDLGTPVDICAVEDHRGPDDPHNLGAAEVMPPQAGTGASAESPAAPVA